MPRTRAQTLLLAALLVLQCLGDAVYLGPPLLLVTAVGAVLALGPSPDTRAGIRRVAVAIALATIVVLPLYLEYALVARANPDLHHQTVWGADEVYVNLGGVLPFSGPLALDRMIFVPILAGLALRTVGPPDRRNARAWICAGTFFVVTLVVSWTLPSVIPGLRGELESLGVRAPLRAGFVGRMGICLLVGLGLASCVRAERVLPPALGRLAAVLLLVAVLASRWPYAPFALGEHPLYPAPMVGEEAELLRAGSGAVLVLPLGRRGRDQNGQAVAMYRATAHWRPLFNGYRSYYPAGFEQRMELVRRLPDPKALDALRNMGLRTIVVYSSGLRRLVQGPWLAGIRGGQVRGVRIALQNEDVMVIDVAPPT